MRRFSLPVLLISALLVTGCNAANPGSVPADISGAQWLILGPFPNPMDQGCPGYSKDFLADSGGEANAAPRPGETVFGLRWAPVKAAHGRLDLLSAFGGATNAVAYAYLEFDSRIVGPAALKLGSDDGVKAWCNGILVWDNHVHRALTRDSDAVRVDLSKGKNRLLLKIDQGTGAWEFAARFRSLAEEEREWAAAANRRYKVFLSSQVVADAGDCTCIVATQPGFAVSEKVDIVVTDDRGRTAGSGSAVTGKQTAVPLPSDAKGVYFVGARDAREPAESVGSTAAVVVGDLKEAASRAIMAARSAKPEADQPAATLEFLADELEGELDPSLCTQDRNLRAIATIAQIKGVLDGGAWRADALTGLHQWAYRSSIDGSCQPYSLILPSAYDPMKRYGLVVVLHGYTSNDFDAAGALASSYSKDYIVAAPYGRGDTGYRSIGEQDVLDVMDTVQRLYSIDPDRIYLMGFSMGGMGTWRIGQNFTDRFAAIAPFCGWTGPYYLENLKNTPTLIVHGDEDSSVPIGMDQAAAESLKKLGAPVRFEVMKGSGHGVWDDWSADQENNIFDFFGAHARDRWPVSIAFRVTHLRYGTHFWARVDELSDPPQMGRLSAEVSGNRSVRVETAGVSAFALDLRHPTLSRSGNIALIVDGQGITAKAGQSEAFLVREESGRWRAGSPPKKDVVRHDGGGVYDLYSGPLAIVYGTRKKERMEALRRAAETVFDWAPTSQIPLGSRVGRFRIMSDIEATAADLRNGNVFLFGDASENKYTAEQLSKMPITVGQGFTSISGNRIEGSGLVAVYPNAWAPRYLATVVIFPQGTNGNEQALEYFLIALRAYNLDETSTYQLTLNDLLVFSDVNQLSGGGKPVWAGHFDRDWRHPTKTTE